MKLLPLIAAALIMGLTTVPAAAAPMLGDTIICAGSGLFCSAGSATMGSSVEFTGNFGPAMPILSFNFSNGMLNIGNAADISYGVVGTFSLAFRDTSNPFTEAALISSDGFYGLSQSEFSLSNGLLSFSSTAFSATKNATLTLRVGSPGAVPEPASWLMMILGTGLIGFALRRQTDPKRKIALG